MPSNEPEKEADLAASESDNLLEEVPQNEGGDIPIESDATAKEIEKYRQELSDGGSKVEETDHLRIKYQKDITPVSIAEKDRENIESFSAESLKELEKTYEQGFGIFPASDPKENFYEQIWTRDFAHASGNFFETQNPQAVKDSLETIFSHQKENGMLPLRVEKQYMMLKLTPFLRGLAKPAFNLIEKRIKGRGERPVYEGQDFSGAEDTVPAAIIAAGEFFVTSQEGRKFAEENFDKLKLALDFFETKVDPADGLASVKTKNSDWLDSIKRTGKLGGINVLWARSLKMMSFMASQLGKDEDAHEYREKFQKTKAGIMEKLYDKEGAYFRAEEGTNRIEATASIFGSLYLLGPKECARVQATLKSRLKTPSGLKNFDPPYPRKQVLTPHKLIGLSGYQNEFVWPWVTCQNIQAKIKIAQEHQDSVVRDRFKKEAVEDLLDMTKLFKDAGGAYEIFEPDSRKPAIKRFYKPPKNIMGNLAAYEGAHLQMKELGWI